MPKSSKTSKSGKQKPDVVFVDGEVYARTLAILTTVLGVDSDTTIQKWRANGCPGRESRGWPVGAIVRWKLDRERDRQRLEIKDDQLQKRLEIAHVKKAESEAAKQEIILGELTGRFVDANEMLAEVSEVVNIMRSRLEQIAGECAAAIPPDLRDDLTQMIHRKIRLACSQLADLAEASDEEYEQVRKRFQ